MEILKEDEVNVHDAKKILEERQKEADLVYEQKICIEFLEKISKTLDVDVPQLKGELEKIVILRPRHIALIINILPDTEEEVQSIFSKETINLKKEELGQIIEAVKKFKK
jgi:DNA-directed RNA polymerase subunit F